VGTIASRLAKLEQQAGGGGGTSAYGVRRVNHSTGTGPDVVKLLPSGEEMTQAQFLRRFPHGLIVVRTEYGGPTGDDLVPT
jgi:hypothetical protein